MSLRSFGYVTVAAHGTPVQLTKNIATTSAGRDSRVGLQSIGIQALPGNAGIIYIGKRGMNKTTGVEMLNVLPKPTSATTGPFPSVSYSEPVAPAGLNLQEIFIDSDNDGDGVIISGIGG